MPETDPVPELRASTAALLASFDLTIDPTRRAEYYRAGWWRRGTVLDDFLRVCERDPGKTAIVTYRADVRRPERVSYGELRAHIGRAAAAFERLGIGPGDVVSAQMPNWWQFAVVAMAAMRVGAAFNPITPIHRRREAGVIAGILGSKAYVVPRHYRGFDYPAMLARVAAEVPAIAHRIVVGGPPGEGELSFETDLLAAARDNHPGAGRAERVIDPDQIADVMFTSGTTGEPKGVGHTHNTQFARARAVYETLRLGPADTVFMPSTVGHSTGFIYGCVTPLMLGMTAVYQDVWDPGRALRIIERERPTWTFGSTSFIVDLIRANRKRSADTSSFRYLIAGGAKIPPTVAAEVRDELGARLMAVWGMTENGATTITYPDEPDLAAAESDGKACPWMELKVTDEGTGASLPPGSPGLLRARGASQMIGYVRRPALTSASFDADGWFDTGDIAALSDDGHLRITGRTKDLIIRGGENIPVAEIESVLYAHPAIDEVAIVSYPDERLGERACAVVVPVAGATVTLGDLAGHLEAAGVSRTYWPERLQLREEMPRTLSGKIQKFRLRESLGRADTA